MANIHDVNESLQVQPSVKNLPTLIALSQGENGRSLQFRMVGATIPSGSSASLSGTKPDGVVYSKAGTVDGNTVIFQEDVQLTAVAGAWDAKIHIVNSGDSVATALIRFIIEPDPVAEGAIPSDSQMEGIVAECRAYAEEARSSAYGSPLVASLVADMIDHTRVYVYVGSEDGYTAGNWYYWNGIAWTSGGVYNSAAVQLDTTLTLAGVAAEAKAVGDALKDKADKSGVIDNAKQLLSTIRTTNSEPYTYRPMPEGAGDREYLSVVGGTLGWNQLCNGSSVTVQSGHKYIAKISGAFSIGASTGTAITGLTSGTDMVTDLTICFGTTIADYIYSLETANAGAGVAWVKRYIDLDTYHEYDAGTLKSVEGLESHDTVGFNQWDEEWELGQYNASGNKDPISDRIRSKNYIPVFPSTDYYALKSSSTFIRICYYDSEKTFISYADRSTLPIIFTTPANCQYIRFNLNTNYGTTYNHDICINISDSSRNGQYEPYEKHSYPFDSTITLRGIPKLDSDHKLYFDGDMYSSDGRLRRRYLITDLGELAYVKHTSGSFYAALTGSKTLPSGTLANLLCLKYVTETTGALDAHPTSDNIIFMNTNSAVIVIRDSAYADSDAAAFKTAMSGVYLLYELATPTTETAQPFTSPQVCASGGTEEFVSDSLIPVGSIAEYPADLRKQIENIYGIPTPPSTNGNYRLRVTVSGGVPTFSWASDS